MVGGQLRKDGELRQTTWFERDRRQTRREERVRPRSIRSSPLSPPQWLTSGPSSNPTGSGFRRLEGHGTTVVRH